MLLLGDLLKGRRIPGLEASDNRRICADTASALLKLKLSARQFKYEDGSLTLSIPPIVKAELLLRQEEYGKLLSAQGISLRGIR